MRDFQLFLRPDEVTPIIGAAEVKPAVERALQMARARLGAVTPVSTDFGEAPDVRVPSTRITQIVLNLLLNAADALADRAVERQPRRGGGCGRPTAARSSRCATTARA